MMQLQSVDGPFSWKDFSSIRLFHPVELLKCSSCGEIGYRPKDTKEIDRATEATIRTLTGAFISAILAREGCSQIILAQRIGVTPEYLSGLKSGSRTPGFQTFNILKIFAEDRPAFQISDPTFEVKQAVSDSDAESYEIVLKKLA
jgi:DNA-binding transcriptional regulator YiaG